MSFSQVTYSYKILTPTSQQTQNIFFAKSNRLSLFTEMIAIYSKSGTAHINTFCGLLDADMVHILIIANNMREIAKLKETRTAQDII